MEQTIDPFAPLANFLAEIIERYSDAIDEALYDDNTIIVNKEPVIVND